MCPRSTTPPTTSYGFTWASGKASRSSERSNMADFLSTLFGGGAQEDAAAKNAAALQLYQGTANDALTSAYNTGTGALNSAIGAYTPLANLGQQYNQAGSLLTGALGAGGPQGNATAASTFTECAGHDCGQNAAIDAIDRRRAAQGMDASGNADIDAQTFAQNLQNQQYQNWLQTQQTGLAPSAAECNRTGGCSRPSGRLHRACQPCADLRQQSGRRCQQRRLRHDGRQQHGGGGTGGGREKSARCRAVARHISGRRCRVGWSCHHAWCGLDRRRCERDGVRAR